MRVDPFGARAIRITRGFAAPRELVFAAHTQPDLLKRWFGPYGWRLTECEVDLRPGGAWRYALHGPAGATMTLRGRYLEVVVPELLVTTESNPDCHARAGHESLNMTVLTGSAGRTHLTTTVHFATAQARDAVLGTGMARGVAEGLTRLDTLLATVRA